MDKKQFYSMYNRPDTIESATGTEFDKTYTMTIDKDGNKVLKETGKTNRYEKIQSYADECDINTILTKATLDPSILEKQRGAYFDATGMPTNLAEAQSKILEVKNEFQKLPADIRSQFDNSLEKYVARYGSKDWALALGLIKPDSAEKEPIKEDKNNESES